MFGMDANRYSGDQLDPRNLALVHRLARRLRRRLPPTVELGDLVSDGFFGLRNAARQFDPSRAVPFEAFAIVYIEGAMLDGLRVRRRQFREPPSSERVESELVYEPQIERVYSRTQQLSAALRDLPRRMRLVIHLYYFEGLTMNQVGSCLGVSEVRVSQLHARTMTKLRLQLSEPQRAIKNPAVGERPRGP